MSALYLNSLLESLILTDYTEYLEKVGEAYLARPVVEEQYVSSWMILIAHIEKLFEQIKNSIEFTEDDPYESSVSMIKDYKTTGKMKIFTGASEHPVWTPEQNWRFRAVHDWYGHLLGAKSGGHTFSRRGELNTYNRHAKMAPPKARLALFTEIVGQLGAYYNAGANAEQKVTKLWGFDYDKVGAIDLQEYERNFK